MDKKVDDIYTINYKYQTISISIGNINKVLKIVYFFEN